LFLLGAVDLLLLDEIHHLGEDRGSTLETVVVRMRLLNDAYVKKVAELKADKSISVDNTTSARARRYNLQKATWILSINFPFDCIV
jgi:superfamily II helicase